MHAIINNAGICDSIISGVATDEHIRQVLEVNYISAMRLCRLLLPMLHQSSGRIINIGSATAYLPCTLLFHHIYIMLYICI